MFFSKLSATSVIFVVERNTVSGRYGFNGRIMQFIRIAGDDAERSKKYKRPLKVQKIAAVLFMFCVWLSHKCLCAGVYERIGIIYLKFRFPLRDVSISVFYSVQKP